MPDQEPEEGFTIRDRRRSAAPTPPEAAPSPAPAPLPATAQTDAMTESEEIGEMDDLSDMEGMEGDPSALPDVYSILALFMGELRNIAWLRMGLVANPATGQFETDMEQAKVAINTVGFLASQLDAVIAPEEKLPLRALVSDLQLNFAEQIKRSGNS